MAFDATVGGASANSYVTLEAAEDYFLGRLQTDDWDNADEGEREAALMMSTARLDGEPFVGSVVTSTQRLQWPRYGATNRSGYTLSSTAIPELIQHATCELALAILADPEMLGGASGLAEFEHLALGSMDVTPRGSAVGELPMNVQRLIAPVRIGGFQARVVRA